MLATSEESLECQVVLVKVFGEQNLLKLNVSKCEIVLFSSQKSIAFPVCEVEGSVMPAGDVVKCLGYWWRGDLDASTSIDEKIRKARRAFSNLVALVCFWVMLVHCLPELRSIPVLCWSYYLYVRIRS